MTPRRRSAAMVDRGVYGLQRCQQLPVQQWRLKLTSCAAEKGVSLMPGTDARSARVESWCCLEVGVAGLPLLPGDVPVAEAVGS